MAHTKAGGVTKGSRNAQAKRLGVKAYAGQRVQVGDIIVRQRGSKVRPGEGVKQGRDFTLFAMKEGIVEFQKGRMYTFVKVN